MTRLGSDLCIRTTLLCRTLTRYELALRSEEAEKPTDWDFSCGLRPFHVRMRWHLKPVEGFGIHTLSVI